MGDLAIRSLVRATLAALLGAIVLGPGAPTHASPVASAPDSAAQPPPAPSKFRSPDDGWFDLSGFLESRYGFLPVVIPITEPAVGYGAAGGITFMEKPRSSSEAGFGRPDVTLLGGFGTENGTWGTVAGDMRHWMGDRLQTVVGLVYASVNLDFYGIGEDLSPSGRGIRYNLEPKGGLLQGKYRLGRTRMWGGLRYVLAASDVTFESPGESGIPEHAEQSDVGGVTPSVTFDSRDNIFTPTRGTYVEASAGFYDEFLGSDDTFQSVRLIAMQLVPLGSRVFLGVRGDLKGSYGGAPFYMLPYVSMRGAPVLRYQGERVAQVEAEVRWQGWKRFSLVGFGGVGAASNDFTLFESTRDVRTGGGGFRYELARDFGLHAGLDLAFGPDETALYIQVGSAWARP